MHGSRNWHAGNPEGNFIITVLGWENLGRRSLLITIPRLYTVPYPLAVAPAMQSWTLLALAAATAVVCVDAGNYTIPPFLPQTNVPSVKDPFIFLHLVRGHTGECHPASRHPTQSPLAPHSRILFSPRPGPCAHHIPSMSQAKCAGTSLRALLYNKTRDVLGEGEVCIPTYSHKFIVLSRGGCGYDQRTDTVKPALLAGHFIWEEYDWMLRNAQVRCSWRHVHRLQVTSRQ